MSAHAQQREEATERSLNRAGIRRRYHRISLAEFPHPLSARMLEWVNGASRSEPDRGWTIVGGNSAEDLTIMVARGLHLTGRATRVMTLERFATVLSEDREWLRDAVSDVQTIALLQAGPLHPERSDPCFTHREVRRIENWLGDWIADGNRLLVHSPRSLGAWFSAGLVQRVAAVNETVEGGK